MIMTYPEDVLKAAYKLPDNEKELFLRLYRKANKPFNVETWKPVKAGDSYYAITSSGTVRYMPERIAIKSKVGVEIGNCFKDKNDAQLTVEKLKVVRKLKELAANEVIPRWGKGKRYSIAYNHDSMQLVVFAEDKTSFGTGIYFASKENADMAIEKIGRDHVERLFY